MPRIARPPLTTSSVVTALASRAGLRYVLPVTSVESWMVLVALASAQRRVRLEHGLVWGADHGQLIEVIHHEDRVEARCLCVAHLFDNGGEEFGDTGAVGEVGNLISEPNGHSASLRPIRRCGIMVLPCKVIRHIKLECTPASVS